jgi:hypothetical protein
MRCPYRRIGTKIVSHLVAFLVLLFLLFASLRRVGQVSTFRLVLSLLRRIHILLLCFFVRFLLRAIAKIAIAVVAVLTCLAQLSGSV